MNKHIKGLVCAVVMSLTFTQTGVNAFATELSRSDLNLSKSEITRLTKEGKLDDPNFVQGILDARKTKTKLSEIKDLDNKLGTTEFWNSITPEELEEYYIDDDGTVNLRESNNLMRSFSNETTKLDKAKQFEDKLKNYISKIEEFNQSIGVNQKVLQTDGDGRITNIGDFDGDENYNNSCDLTQAVMGDVFIGDKPGYGVQGKFEHAGIFNGSAYSDHCIFSNDGFSHKAGFDSVSGWEKEYNDIYDMNVWSTSYGEASDAYKNAYSTFNKKPYAFSSKTDKSSAYCSKIPWWGYKNAASVDIDSNGGTYVLPYDIYMSDNVSVRNNWED